MSHEITFDVDVDDRATMVLMRHFYRALLEVGHQRDVIGIMQTRAELYDYLGYHEFERKLDELFAASAGDEKAED